MPLFLKHKLLFIHIPKTAGCSIYEVFKKHNDPAIFLGGVFNKHSCQHTSYLELKEVSLVPADFRVFAILRHPIDRFVDEFNYFKGGGYKGDLNSFIQNFFQNNGDWDKHNESSIFFVEGCPNLEWIRFEHLEEDFKKVTGFDLDEHANPSKGFITKDDLTEVMLDMIRFYWKQDYELWEKINEHSL